MSFYKNKRVLVAGGTGLIGQPLVRELINDGAKVRVASLDDSSRAHPEAEFYQLDLTNYENCLSACDGMDIVFNLLCVKGSPKINKEKPASFFEPMILFNINLLKAAKESKVERYLFSSSYAVYSSAVIYKDSIDVLKTPLSENDFYTGLAKRVGEAHARTYKIEFGWDKISIVRPTNTYGPYDNFNLESAMVVPSLIKKVFDGHNPLVVWGDGNAVRDFLYADDAAKGMMLVLEKNPGVENPINLGSGRGYAIKELVETILNYSDKKPEVIWDSSKIYGDRIRVMDIRKALYLGFRPQVSLEEGIKKTIEWYRENRDLANRGYNHFKEKI